MQSISAEQDERKRNFRMQLLIAVASAVLLVAKFIAYFLTASLSVLSDALESIVNVTAAFIGLYSLYVSAKPRDTDHPYGHGKVEFISAAIEGSLVLFAGTLIIYKAVKSFWVPHVIKQLDTGILIIAATALINWGLGQLAVKRGTRHNSLALLASGKHLKTDSYSTFGIIAGLILVGVTGALWIDSALAIAFGGLIIYTGYRILRQSLAGIMDEADMVLLARMIALLNENRRDCWVDLHNLRVIKYGNTLHVDCHLTVPWYLNVNQAHSEIEQLGSLIRKDFGESLELFVHSDGCNYFQCPICDKKECPVRQHPYKKEIVWTVDNILQDRQHGVADL